MYALRLLRRAVFRNRHTVVARVARRHIAAARRHTVAAVAAVAAIHLAPTHRLHRDRVLAVVIHHIRVAVAEMRAADSL